MSPASIRTALFQPATPFQQEYGQRFVDGLLTDDAQLLSFHREAIYYLAEPFAPFVIARLVIICTRTKSADLAETVFFYLENEDRSIAVIELIQSGTERLVADLEKSLTDLERHLVIANQIEIADQVRLFRVRVAGRRQPP